jgi:hypothetical protein
MVPMGLWDPWDHRGLRDHREYRVTQGRRDHRDPQVWTVQMVPTELSDQWGRKDPPG